MVPFSFLVSVLLVTVLQVVPIGGAGVPRNITFTRNSSFLKFSPDWRTSKTFKGRNVTVADSLGSELQVDKIVNATAIHFIGFKSTTGSKFVACLDCSPARNPSRKFKIINAHDPDSDDDDLDPVELFSMTGLDPTVSHSLRVVNLWDSDFGDTSQIAFDRLIVTTVGDVIANVSNNAAAAPSSMSTQSLYPAQSPSNQHGPLSILSVAEVPPTGSAFRTALASSPFNTATVVFASLVGTATQTNPLPTQLLQSSNVPYPNTSVVPAPSPNGSAPPGTAATPTASAAAPTSATTPVPPNPPGNPGNQVPPPKTVSVPGATETLLVPTPTSNAGDSVTPSTALSKALLAIMIVMIVVFLSCLIFGITMLIRRARERNRNQLRLRDDTSSMESGSANRITPYIIASHDAHSSRDSYGDSFRESNRDSYATSHRSSMARLPPLVIPTSPFDGPRRSPTAHTPMAEVYQNGGGSPTRLSSTSHLNPFRESVTELTTSAWLTRSPRFKSERSPT